MLRPNRKKLNMIGLILIVASLVLFSVSIATLMQATSTYSNVVVQPGHSSSFYKKGVTAGDDLHYSMQYNTSRNVTVYAYLTSPEGTHYGNISLSPSTYSGVVVASSSGNWTLIIANSGNNSVNMTVKLGDVSYLTVFGVVFGFALLPSGLALLGISAYSAHVEKRRKMLRDAMK